jgi:hypothetical protein
VLEQADRSSRQQMAWPGSGSSEERVCVEEAAARPTGRMQQCGLHLYRRCCQFLVKNEVFFGIGEHSVNDGY